jgi:hypothetical protein
MKPFTGFVRTRRTAKQMTPNCQPPRIVTKTMFSSTARSISRISALNTAVFTSEEIFDDGAYEVGGFEYVVLVSAEEPGRPK